ncbi:MAG: glycosyltransferase family 2 protein [Chloroflexi bacterium]|nr:glycosyltransferase family 2 protein [Chloroflexota bacterium]
MIGGHQRFAHLGHSGFSAPATFRVVALVAAYNESDIITPSLRHLVSQGIDVYLIDNWSTDGTYELAREFRGRGLVGIERFPEDGPPPTYKWRDLLGRKEELAQEISADWFIHYDVDEIRRSPWPGVTLRDAIYEVDQEGFNCIDHIVLEFCPVDDGYPPGADFEAYFAYFTLDLPAGTYPRVNAWKKSAQRVSLAACGGHNAQFGGRRVFPSPFLLKHYPIRSQSHGKRKVLSERKPRWDPKEKADGWHTQYDGASDGHRFLRKPSDLLRIEDGVFNHLSERMASVAAQEISRLSTLLREREREETRLESLLQQSQDDCGHLQVLLQQSKDEQDNLRAVLAQTEEERRKLWIACCQIEEERNALLAHLSAVANGRVMRLLNKLACYLGSGRRQKNNTVSR